MAAEEEFKIPGFSNLIEIGRGGNSRVYAGTRVKDRRNVVLKVKITDGGNKNDNVVLKVINQLYGLKEYDIGNYFKCDFIANYLEYNSTRKYTYTVMDHEQGSMAIYKGQAKLPYQEKISLLKKLLYGLHECHENGVLHLDMKFENVLLRYRERSGISIDEPLITDFGFSIRVRSVRSGALMTNKFGTTGYFAPEQFPDYYPANERHKYKIYHGSADIWAYGIIAYRLLMENRVYQRNDKEEIHADMIRYFRDGTVEELIKRRKYSSFTTLTKTDQNDVIQLLNGLLTWDHNNRMNTRQLLNLPIFQKSAKLSMYCELRRPEKSFNLSAKSKFLPYCLEYVNDVAMTCPNAQIIIYYHMIDLVYRICANVQYTNMPQKYAREFVVACMLISIDYHYYTNYDGLIRYITDTKLDQPMIVTRASEFAKKLDYIIYRRYLYESATTIEDIDDHLRNIIPSPEAYCNYQANIVDANPVDNQIYDENINAYVTINDVISKL